MRTAQNRRLYSMIAFRITFLCILATVRACEDWCESWKCDGSLWCAQGAKPDPCHGCGCPNWCRSWKCEDHGNEAWCMNTGATPDDCRICACPEWCDGWVCTGRRVHEDTNQNDRFHPTRTCKVALSTKTTLPVHHAQSMHRLLRTLSLHPRNISQLVLGRLFAA